MAPGRRQREPRPRTIGRKIFFYRVNAGVHPDTGDPREINFGPILRHLHQLPFTSEGRYLDLEGGKQLCCWVESLEPPFRLRLANIRRGQYPPVENAGNFSPLILGAGRGLAEITHLTIFSDGICGAEFNFYGPRASQLPFYCALKLKDKCPGFRLNSVVRPDLETRLAAMSDIKILDLKVRASFTSILEQADEDLGAAFSANAKALNARPEDELELVFIRKKKKTLVERAVPDLLLRAVRTLARRPDLKEYVSIFKVGGPGADSALVDILREQFTAERQIEPAADESGAVDPSSMFSAIEHSYENMKELLVRASEIE
jgi:hypothetical protein